ncbi:MAG: hypothetical protein H0W65_06390 [Sphingomonas sp.]|uniref:hypothetical protein n=1 Tax=Sphingomonas sp. TaxID=28214 RepID=UPI0017FF1D5E|nr:hypothetical protein [Sphingomonas sp.]MBA3667333.1 hypothetical protein [Sphingomonas sp.]
MRIVMTSLAVLALVACNKPAKTADSNMADNNMAMDGNAMDANAMAMPAAFQINETTWEFTEDGKPMTETVDASGNYVAWSGDKHIDHGTAAMVDGKVCFTSAMDKMGPECWTTTETAVGATLNTTSDKGKKLAVKRVAYMAVPAAVAP